MRTTLFFCGLLFVVPLDAAAAPYFQTHVCGTAPGCDAVIIGFTKYLPQGAASNASTSGLTKWTTAQTAMPDTVLRVTGPDREEIAYNDDCPGQGRASCVSFVAPKAGLYRYWVHSYSNPTVGRANLVVDGVQVRSMAKFSGTHHYARAAVGDVINVVPNNKSPLPDGSVRNTDTVLFLIGGDQRLVAWDDDDGPNLHARSLVTTAVDHVLVAYYPDTWTGGSIGLLVDDPKLPDTDYDGLSDAVEVLIGSDAFHADTDSDGVPDYFEVVGNDGFNYAEYGRVASPDIFVEIDVMTAPDPMYQRSPPSSLGYDLFHQNPFGPGPGVPRIHVFVDDQMHPADWARYLCNGTCSGLSDSVDFWWLRDKYFVSKSPERVPYFKYGIWGYQFGDAYYSMPSCASGLAEYPGANFMITLGCMPLSLYSDAKMRGTFLHELGHLLNLGHHGNDQGSAASVVHQSHMNYRYIWEPVPPDNYYWTQPAFRFSRGMTPPASCETSPKYSCEKCRAANLCGTPECQACDTDVNEAAIAELGHGSHDGWWAYGLEAVYRQPSPNSSKSDLGWRGPRWNESTFALQSRARLSAFLKELSGMQRDLHFRLTADETRIFSTCGQ